MDCGRCGIEIESQSPDGLFNMDEEIVCRDCGATNQIGVDEDEPFEGAGYGTAYVSHWACKHGADDATPCAACDAEDEAASPPNDRGSDPGEGA